MHYRCSASFALFWNLCKSVVPNEIINDFLEYLQELGIGRMDGNGAMSCDAEGKGSYKVEIEAGPNKKQEVFEFNNVDLAPPTGVSGENYARCVHYLLNKILKTNECAIISFIHREGQPHKWAVSWTTSRFSTMTHEQKDLGGHFYIAQYGVRIQAAANTIIAWQPRDWHGTSLHALCGTDDRSDPTYHQRGLAFVTSARLKSVWLKYKGNQYSRSQAINELYPENGELHDSEPNTSQLPKTRKIVHKLTSTAPAIPTRKSTRLIKLTERGESYYKSLKATTDSE